MGSGAKGRKREEGRGENGGRYGAAEEGAREKQVVTDLPLLLREVWGGGGLRLGRRS